MPTYYTIPTLPLGFDFETKAILSQLNKASRKLAELKGVALTIPNENILLSSLVLQEAKDILARTAKCLEAKMYRNGKMFRHIMMFSPPDRSNRSSRCLS